MNENRSQRQDHENEPSALARFFLIRPVFAILCVAMLVISGLMAYQSVVKEVRARAAGGATAARR